MKKLVLFDFDGTLADTSEGIIYCYNKAAEHFGCTAVKDKTKYFGIIGGTLEEGFSRLWKALDKQEISQAVKLYRENYSSEYVQKSVKLYEGMIKTLEELKNAGCKLAVATLKHERFVSNMLDELGIKEYFDVVGAYNGEDCKRKKDILNKVCRTLNIEKKDAVLVGDSSYDAEGSREAGIDFCAVTYGWGFQTYGEADVFSPLYICNSPQEIAEKICG